jgi:regulatory protein
VPTRSSSSRPRTPRHLPERHPIDPVELATRALSRHDRSRHELEERLTRAGVGETERDEALATLERVGYLDDGRLAAARAETLAARGQGDRAIRIDLERRGIAAEAIEEALAAIAPESERAARLAERLGRTPKAFAGLRRKGFSEEALEAAFGEALQEMPPEL